MSVSFYVILCYMILLVFAAASVGTEQMSTGHLVPLLFPLPESVNTGGTNNTREHIRKNSPVTNLVFSIVCEKFDNKI